LEPNKIEVKSPLYYQLIEKLKSQLLNVGY